ncbi:hypothetical protein AGMMS49960_18230 [Betaproteobacteria bacterium]|nr:hypothetical protein AGMMS49543_22900 [Betaproteobacteria bacterium]GHU03605.1 hypothetical protein AGMMS49960_18230 [Betaproteobacteria bacterium]GHU23349.1 hypothetical protein AGMMS50243_24610 [Betaproteobacteria bacterium]
MFANQAKFGSKTLNKPNKRTDAPLHSSPFFNKNTVNGKEADHVAKAQKEMIFVQKPERVSFMIISVS